MATTKHAAACFNLHEKGSNRFSTGQAPRKRGFTLLMGLG
jgi:hypothetical protein